MLITPFKKNLQAFQPMTFIEYVLLMFSEAHKVLKYTFIQKAVGYALLLPVSFSISWGCFLAHYDSHVCCIFHQLLFPFDITYLYVGPIWGETPWLSAKLSNSANTGSYWPERVLPNYIKTPMVGYTKVLYFSIVNQIGPFEWKTLSSCK